MLQLLGIAGYEGISSAPTDAMTGKVLQFLGQRYVTSSETSLNKEILLTVRIIFNNTIPYEMIFYSFAALIRKILFAPPCNILCI